MTPDPTTRLREIVEAAGWTRLDAAEADGGWRLHDFPDKPNPKGVWFADLICEGLTKEDAAAFIVGHRLLCAVADPAFVEKVARIVSGQDIYGQIPVGSEDTKTAARLVSLLAAHALGE